MLARVSCPVCHHKFSIPEGAMGTRQVCSNCQSPFIAGTGVSESVAAGNPPLGSSLGYHGTHNTMLGSTAPAIKYNCPRCQAPLEAPASEAGTRSPCPACGQRLQVPAAPPPPAAPIPQPA